MVEVHVDCAEKEVLRVGKTIFIKVVHISSILSTQLIIYQSVRRGHCLISYGDDDYKAKYKDKYKLDIVNSADSAFFILKLVSLVSLNPHSIFILVAFSSLLHLYPRCIFIPVES